MTAQLQPGDVAADCAPRHSGYGLLRRLGILQWGLCRLLHNPRLIRGFAVLLRHWPGPAAWLGVVARRDAVTALLEREDCFSNSTHAPNLIAGPFVLGMDRGAGYEADREMLLAALARVDPVTGGCAVTAAESILPLLAGGVHRFDLVDDCLMPVVWAGLSEAFGNAENALAGPDPLEFQKTELRPVAAHVLLKPFATPAADRRACEAAGLLHDRFTDHAPAIATAWRAADLTAVRRNAMGLAYIGHSVTVQAGVLAMRELLARPAVWRDLHGQARQLGHQPWSNPAFRGLLRNHVIELLRFRPVFPILNRNVLRDAFIDIARGRTAHVEGGDSVKTLPISAMFDPDAFESPHEYHPAHPCTHALDREMVFGHGPRSCLGQSQGLEILVTAFAALLQLPDLRWEGPLRRRAYDGPFVSHAFLRCGS